MPEYLVDINRIPKDEEVFKMINDASNPRDRALVSILWLTGARPSELRTLTTEHITSDSDTLSITLKNLKVTKKSFFPRTRTLTFSKGSDFTGFLLSYVNMLPKGEHLFLISLRRIEQIIETLSNGAFCPYNFRHGRLTLLSQQGFTPDELLSFKGSMSLGSVEPYIRGKRLTKVVSV